MPPLQLAGSELNSNTRLSNQWGPGPTNLLKEGKKQLITAWCSLSHICNSQPLIRKGGITNAVISVHLWLRPGSALEGLGNLYSRSDLHTLYATFVASFILCAILLDNINNFV